MNFDIAIVGGGPIGASTAYFLLKNGFTGKLCIIDDKSNERATYKSAGGCLRWTWDDPLKREMTSVTADFIKEKVSEGLDLSLINDNYYFVYNGKFTPAMNLRGAALVDYFLNEAVALGAVLFDDKVSSVTRKNNEYQILTASDKSVMSSKVLLALGVHNENFMPGLNVEHEKRQIFVVDTKVDSESKNLPHTIVPVGDDGYGFVFLKNIAGELKFVVGQEDIINDDNEESAVDYYKDLMDSDLGNIFPYLKDASVEKILWGIDAGNKKLEIIEKDNLFAAHCGSAIRSCVYIGQAVSQALVK